MKRLQLFLIAVLFAFQANAQTKDTTKSIMLQSPDLHYSLSKEMHQKAMSYDYRAGKNLQLAGGLMVASFLGVAASSVVYGSRNGQTPEIFIVGGVISFGFLMGASGALISAGKKKRRAASIKYKGWADIPASIELE